MKKLLALVLVCVVATMANAALQISTNGNTVATEIDVPMGGSLVLGVWTNSNITAASSTAWALVCQTGGGISGGAYVGPTGTYTDPILGVTDNFKGVTSSNIDGLVLPGEDGVQGTITIWSSGEMMDENGDPYDPAQYYPSITSGTVLFDGVAFLGGSLQGDVIIHLYTINNTSGAATLRDTVVAHVVPEPATMALLALGGLLFRRK